MALVLVAPLNGWLQVGTGWSLFSAVAFLVGETGRAQVQVPVQEKSNSWLHIVTLLQGLQIKNTCPV